MIHKKKPKKMVEFPDIREKEKRLVFYKNKELCFIFIWAILFESKALLLFCANCVRYSILHEFLFFNDQIIRLGIQTRMYNTDTTPHTHVTHTNFTMRKLRRRMMMG
jgi:hypothetical protein